MSFDFKPGWNPELAERARQKYGHRYTQATFADDRPLPPAFSLAKFRRWPFDQGQVGSCFANAAAQLAQIDLACTNFAAAFAVSRHLIWYQGRKLDGSLGSWGDGGSVTNAMVAMAEGDGGVGVCHDELCPYQASHGALEAKPSAAAFADAQLYKLTAMAEVKTDEQAKRAIYNGNGNDLGMWWPNGWDTAVDKTGRVTGIGRGGYGHSLLRIGWIDDWDGYLWWQIENSHGPIYHPVPPDVAGTIPGYLPATPTATYDFWVRKDWFDEVMGYGNAESLTAAGPAGWKPRYLDWDEVMS